MFHEKKKKKKKKDVNIFAFSVFAIICFEFYSTDAIKLPKVEGGFQVSSFLVSFFLVTSLFPFWILGLQIFLQSLRFYFFFFGCLIRQVSVYDKVSGFSLFWWKMDFLIGHWKISDDVVVSRVFLIEVFLSPKSAGFDWLIMSILVY